MLEPLDEIDLKSSLRACSWGRDFISVSNAFQVIIFFRSCDFFNSLNKKRMNGGAKIFEKKIGPHACLRVNNYSFLWWALSFIGNLLLPGRARANDATNRAQ